MTVALAFVPELRRVNMTDILPSRPIAGTGIGTSLKYLQIRASMKELGMIEPLSVFALPHETGRVLLLDGHVRLRILRELGELSALCLFATDDESFSYNTRVSHLSPTQEMTAIRQAIELGVSVNRLSRALHLPADRLAVPAVTSCDRPIKPARRRRPSQTFEDRLSAVRKEQSGVDEQVRLAEQSYRDDALDLAICASFMTKLLEHPPVTRYLERIAPDVLKNLQECLRS